MSELERLCEANELTAEFCFGEAHEPARWDAAHNWRVHLEYKGRKLSVDFYGGAAVTNPTAADVVSSLCLDVRGYLDEDEFNEFSFGLEGGEAVKLYKKLQESGPKIVEFFGEDLEVFAGAEH